jgi:hypothetical protein
MGNILKRKDKTSIFCRQSLGSRRISELKVKFAELIIAFALIVLGTWIIILAN